MVTWKKYWREEKKSTKTEVNEVIEKNSRFLTTGLNTGLKPTFGIKGVKHGSDHLNFFLTAAGKTLLKEAFKRRCFERLN